MNGQLMGKQGAVNALLWLFHLNPKKFQHQGRDYIVIMEDIDTVKLR